MNVEPQTIAELEEEAAMASITDECDPELCYTPCHRCEWNEKRKGGVE
jgi:hypothetical protein